MPKPVLAIDTSLDYCSVAIGDEQHILYADTRHTPRGHSEALHATVSAGMRQVGWRTSAAGGRLAAVVVTTGPGSFTGLRIGVAAAKGFAHAWGLPLVGITTLEGIAAGAVPAGTSAPAERPVLVAVAVPTRSGHVHAGLFAAETGGQVGEMITAMPEEALVGIRIQVADAGLHKAGELVLAGSPWRSVRNCLRSGETLALTTNDWPDPAILAAIGARKLATGGGLPPAEITPVYLRRPGVIGPADVSKD